MFSPPPAQRFIVEDLEQDLRFTIPTRLTYMETLGAIVIGGFALLVAIVELSLFTATLKLLWGLIMTGFEQQMTVDILTMLLATTMFGVLAYLQFNVFNWRYYGKETIEVSEKGIKVSRTMKGFSCTRKYGIKHIKNIRYLDHYSHTRSWRDNVGGGFYYNDGAISFDYGTSEVHIGSDIDGEDARKLLIILLKKYPEYTSLLKYPPSKIKQT